MQKLLLLLVLLLTGCVGLPDNVRPVNRFELNKYLGKWYEIARLDHPFEEGLSNITAEYSMGAEGSVKVINRGYVVSEHQWQQAEGKAYFVDGSDKGYLKVSFFEPFYASYIVFELDHDNYQYALVSGPDKSYFWLLAREKKIPEAIKNVLLAKAAALGFDTSQLIYPSQAPLK